MARTINAWHLKATKISLLTKREKLREPQSWIRKHLQQVIRQVKVQKLPNLKVHNHLQLSSKILPRLPILLKCKTWWRTSNRLVRILLKLTLQLMELASLILKWWITMQTSPRWIYLKLRLRLTLSITMLNTLLTFRGNNRHLVYLEATRLKGKTLMIEWWD